jgi:hypothetical protein
LKEICVLFKIFNDINLRHFNERGSRLNELPSLITSIGTTQIQGKSIADQIRNAQVEFSRLIQAQETRREIV